MPNLLGEILVICSTIGAFVFFLLATLHYPGGFSIKRLLKYAGMFLCIVLIVGYHLIGDAVTDDWAHVGPNYVKTDEWYPTWNIPENQEPVIIPIYETVKVGSPDYLLMALTCELTKTQNASILFPELREHGNLESLLLPTLKELHDAIIEGLNINSEDVAERIQLAEDIRKRVSESYNKLEALGKKLHNAGFSNTLFCDGKYSYLFYSHEMT